MFSNEQSADEMRRKIVAWVINAASAYQQETICRRAGHMLGRVMHTLEDTYAPSHVLRDANWRILLYQDYGAQGNHGEGDDPEINAKAFHKAIEVMTDLLNRVICDQQSSGSIKTFLEQDVLRHAEAVNIGGTAPAYR